MELFILIIILLVLCLILNVSLHYILLAGMVLLCLFSAAMTLGFVYGSICLICSKRKEARFSRIDHVKNRKFRVAYYWVEEVEYPCAFPGEGVLEDKLYQKDKTYHVMLHQRTGKVYDCFAVTTCMIGLVFSIGLSIGLTLLYLGA